MPVKLWTFARKLRIQLSSTGCRHSPILHSAAASSFPRRKEKSIARQKTVTDRKNTGTHETPLTWKFRLSAQFSEERYGTVHSSSLLLWEVRGKIAVVQDGDHGPLPRHFLRCKCDSRVSRSSSNCLDALPLPPDTSFSTGWTHILVLSALYTRFSRKRCSSPLSLVHIAIIFFKGLYLLYLLIVSSVGAYVLHMRG